MSKINCNPKNMEVLLQDQTTEIIGLLFHKQIQEMTLFSDTQIDDTSIIVTASSTPLTGSCICMKQDRHFYQATIISSSPSGSNFVIQLDNLLDYEFNSGIHVVENTTNMAIDGSVIPQIFQISPRNLTNVEWDITGISGCILDQAEMDDNKFGGMTKLSNGILLRMYNETIKNIMNIKSNGEFKLYTFNVDYSTKAPSGYYGLNFFKEFGGQHNDGVVVRLSSVNNCELQVIIHDDLRGLNDFKIIAHGHYCN
jgi:hypothetical protein